MLPSSVEEGKLWPKAMAGVVRPARVPTTPRWLPPVLPLLIQGGELFLVLMSPLIAARSQFHQQELRPYGAQRVFAAGCVGSSSVLRSFTGNTAYKSRSFGT